MITWLFTQVWLWSLAAFALGALITWLLFVRPLRRQLAELTAVYPEAEYAYEEDERTGCNAPLDLLQPAPQRWERPDEPEVGDWGRAPRAWVAPEKADPAQPDPDSAWFREWDERVNGADPADAAVTAVQPRVPPAAGDPKPEEPEADEPTASVKPVEPPAAKAPVEPPVVKTPVESPGAKAPVEPPAVKTPVESPVVKTPVERPAADRTAATAPAEEPATDISAWPEAEPAESRISGRLEDSDDATESRLSGQLRSLFETVEPRSGGAVETPYVPPVGADATQVIPKVGDRGAEGADSAAEPPPLPRRTPGAGPRPGREGGSGPMIKGHSASRQYHSPESPAYDKIVADVWFRTPADAEIAGFEPWNGQRST
ncbi:hypothetical protein AB0I53_45645 [Saccharopolyspora sp. NPDC050389]|uniref:sunset domain-containing protein n=1 Tax=Saccharopolyspora sp. NPDC050389 TaxID=3155516 RepID=UPI00340CE84D